MFLGKRGFFGNDFLTGCGDVGEMGESQGGPQRFETEGKRIAHRRGRMEGGQKSGHSIFMKNEPSQRNLECPLYSASSNERQFPYSPKVSVGKKLKREMLSDRERVDV